MAVTVTHPFVSTVDDDEAHPELIQPGDWNAEHVVTGAAEVVSGTITKTVGPTGDFTTIPQAMTWLNSLVYDTASVTLSFQDGIYTNEASLIFRGFRPTVTLAAVNAPLALTTTTFTASQTPAGVAGAYPYTLTFASVAGAEVGKYVVINPTAGTNYQRMGGCFKITAVDTGANTITILNTHRNTTFASGTITGTVYMPQAVIRCTTHTGGTLIYAQNSAVSISNMTIAMETTSSAGYTLYSAVGGMIALNGTAVGVFNATPSGGCITIRNSGTGTTGATTKIGISGPSYYGVDIQENGYFSFGVSPGVASQICIGGMVNHALNAAFCGNIVQNGSTASVVMISGSANSLQSTNRGYIRIVTLVNAAVTTTVTPTGTAVAGLYDTD